MLTVSPEFLDTNILVYEWDASNPEKRETARSLVRSLSSRAAISSQVAQELSWTLSKKLHFSAGEVSRILQSYRVFHFVPIEMGIVQRTLSTAESNRISFWDALIVEAAVKSGCKLLHTEDLNHGQEIRGVRVVNPFL